MPKETASSKRQASDDGPKKMKRPKKDPNAPKKPMSAYLLYCNAHRDTFAKQHASFSFGEVTSALAVEWKNVSEKEKASFQEEAQKQRDRYIKDKEAYVPDPEYAKKVADFKKARKEQNAEPLREPPRNPFLIFCDENREAVEEANPAVGLTVVAALLADQWQNLSGSETAKYQAMADAEVLVPVAASKPKSTKGSAKAATKEQEAKKKEKVKKLKTKVKGLKETIAGHEKAIKAANKMEAKLAEKKEELSKMEAKLEDLKPKKDAAAKKEE
eukprot:TRINITY_DN54402_c0_g1_i1.p1 TRINITY_DN54402_c0_g1~~TRINITY_DN54402_c0_g1_i1.p1  ORF type:complete len:272 (-),score=107.64 TRINITY_DN54402_c0_g1_i1:383-1198(-)